MKKTKKIKSIKYYYIVAYNTAYGTVVEKKINKEEQARDYIKGLDWKNKTYKNLILWEYKNDKCCRRLEYLKGW